jgi:predicted acyltransferase
MGQTPAGSAAGASTTISGGEPRVEYREPSTVQSNRLMSLDVFRGATIAAMILVNNPGNRFPYPWLEHAEWNGWTPTDLIFPFFLFIVGVSLVLSFRSRLGHGESKRALLIHSMRRSITLFVIGLLLNFSLPLSTWRIPGVLQRIALCYLAASVITLYSGSRARMAWIAGALVGYWALVRLVPVPGFGTPGAEVELLHPDGNIVAWLDRLIVPGALYEKTRDPEGLLSTIPAIATVLLGVATGEWLQSARSMERKARGMVLAGLTLVAAGELWNLWLPINKKMWTSSYVLFTAGAALLCLALCYWWVDIRKWRGWTKPFLVFGMNAITAYVLSEVLAIVLWRMHAHYGRALVTAQDYLYRTLFGGIRPLAAGSLAFSLSFVMVCFLPLWWMYRRRIIIKI